MEPFDFTFDDAVNKVKIPPSKVQLPFWQVVERGLERFLRRCNTLFYKYRKICENNSNAQKHCWAN